jgi:hypothetical protein
MDIDMDLLNQFRTMNTNDKDHLIAEFKRLSNLDVSSEVCCFYLDMAEWNLNTALWAFYEYEGQNPSGFTQRTSQMFELPEMRFLCDITNGEGEAIQPNTSFIKSWRIMNTGKKFILIHVDYSSLPLCSIIRLFSSIKKKHILWQNHFLFFPYFKLK